MKATLCVGLALIVCGALLGAAHADRIGFREDFAAADGWEVVQYPNITGMASITSDGQATTFTTLAGTFMAGASAAWAPDWPDWDKNTPPGLAMITKKFPGTVDLDRYHFLVARVTYSGTYMALAVNRWDTKVCYTTGLHAVDLRDLQRPSLRGTQPIELRLTFLNTGGRVTLDEVRLVDALTPEEQAGFIPAGFNLRLERLEPKPYHGLEALNARAGAPIRFDLPEERTVFRDTSTGATIWKLTRTVRTEFCDFFSPDGSALPIYHRAFRGLVLYDFAHGGLRHLPDLKGAPVFSRSDPSRLFLLQSAESGGRVRYMVQAVNFRTSATETVAEWESADSGSAEFAQSPYSDLLLLGLKEGRALYLIDPRVRDASQRVRRIALPMRMKGAFLSHDDQRVTWSRCYFFQCWQMDLATGKTEMAHSPTYGAHNLMGRDATVGRYVTMLLWHRLGVLPLDETQSDQVRIWANWATPVPSDYGQLSVDDRWAVTNGMEGELAGKRMLIDGHETGTLLQVVHDFTSRNSWDCNTYSRLSPDTTKIAYMSDALGDTDVYIALTRRPQAPRDLTLSREGAQVRLRWQPSASAREVAGYNVYRSRESGRGYQRINRERILGTEFVDTPPSGAAFYAVAAEEHSELEGLYSEEAHTGDATRFRVFADVEEGALTPPLRQHFDGDCSNFRCVRIWKETPQEQTGTAAIQVAVPADGLYHVWARAKGRGEFLCSAAKANVASEAWSWVRADPPLSLRAGRQTLTLRSESDGLCLDLLLLTNSADDRPTRPDDRGATPSAVQGLRAVEATPNQARLAWTASSDPNVDFYSVHVGEQPDFEPGNATILASGKSTEFLDWGFKPGRPLHYKVLAVSKRGVASSPAAIRVDIPSLESATLELRIEDATLGDGLARGESKGFAFAWLPQPLAANAPRPKATWKFSAPLDGTYYLWARYTTLDAKRVSLLWVETDGEQRLHGTNWRLRFPCTLTRHLGGVTPDEATWFTDKIASGWWAGPFDSVTLTRGEHTLSVAFEPTHAPNGPRLSAVFLSNDPSYRAPGFDPRVDFRK